MQVLDAAGATDVGNVSLATDKFDPGMGHVAGRWAQDVASTPYYTTEQEEYREKQVADLRAAIATFAGSQTQGGQRFDQGHLDQKIAELKEYLGIAGADDEASSGYSGGKYSAPEMTQLIQMLSKGSGPSAGVMASPSEITQRLQMARLEAARKKHEAQRQALLGRM